MAETPQEKPPTKFVVHTVSDSPPGRAVEITLKFLELPYEIKIVDFDNGEHLSEEFLKMYPQGEIPVLQDDGLAIGESVAIIQYLAEKYGQKRENFYPINDPVKRSVIHHRLSFHLSTLQRRVYDYMILPMDYAYERSDEDRIKLTHALTIFDEFLKRQQQQSPAGNVTAGLYATGEHFTIADPPLIMATCALVAMDPTILEPFPGSTKWFANFQEKHPDLWMVAKEGLDGLSHYCKHPRDLSHLKHPIHPTQKGRSASAGEAQ